jgi:hypothetical protein
MTKQRHTHTHTQAHAAERKGEKSDGITRRAVLY